MNEDKVLNSSPNKLFIAWLEELVKTSKRSNDKTYFTYKKALASLKKFPLPLKSGKECIILIGFGNKTCELIDKKLAELSKNQGLSIRKTLKKANKELSQGCNKNVIDYSEGSDVYSIICGLNDLEENSHSESITGFIKKDIIQIALKYFKTPSNSNLSEMLWKCIGKMLKNNLISKDGVRYRLTTAGKDLYNQWSQTNKPRKRRSENESLHNEVDLKRLKHSKNGSNEDVSQIVKFDQKINTANCLEVDKTSNCQLLCDLTNEEPKSDGFRFYYCKSLEPSIKEFVNHKSDAASKIIHGKTYFRIKARHDDLIAFKLDFEIDFSNLDLPDDDMFVFIPDKQAPNKGSFVEEIKINRPEVNNHVIEKSQLLQGNPIISSKMSHESSTKVYISNESKNRSNGYEKNVSKTSKCILDVQAEPIMNYQNSKSNEFSDDLRKILNQKPIKEFQNHRKSDENPEISYIMPPNSFEVILIADSRENFGIEKLKDHFGVKLETRSIPIGDFIWIARDKNGREAVLDVIIERKRYDDLAKSVQDQRFRDQKLRMKRSGISQIIYLLEKCRGMHNLSMTVEALHQTLINSQIYYSTDIRITENSADTISYINLLTVKLIENFSKKSLTVYEDYIPKGPTTRINSFTSPAIDYPSFMESGKKTKPIKVSEMFAKHLTCINGITAEKAKAIIDKYPVPRILIEAYEQCPIEKNRLLLLSGLKLASGRSIGAADSKKVHLCYSRTG